MNWVEAASFAALPEGDAYRAVCANGTPVTLYLVDGEVFATAAMCTHGAAQMCDGFLEGHEIECPLHQGRFDVRTGKALNAPLTEDIAVYPVKVDNGMVFVGFD